MSVFIGYPSFMAYQMMKGKKDNNEGFPDQAWTVVGKTNEDEDRATIANITGNGNDLVCLNLGFIEGSGYNEEGEYAGYLVTDGGMIR